MRRGTAAFSITLAILSIAAALSLCVAMPAVQAQDAVGPNALSGTVYDANHNPIPGAKVTLYYTQFIVNDYKAAGLVKVPDNPQSTGNGAQSSPGTYEFTGILPDVYILTAEKGGVAYSETIQVKDESKTEDLTIPGYVEKATVTPASSPSNPFRPTYTSMPSDMDNTQDLDLGALVLDVLKISLMTVVVLQFLTGIVVIARRIGQQK